jgi:hypothetical protein
MNLTTNPRSVIALVRSDWVEFTVTNKVTGKSTCYSKELFERLVDDKFIACEVIDDAVTYLWTERYAFEILIQEHLGNRWIVGVPRNPDYGKAEVERLLSKLKEPIVRV